MLSGSARVLAVAGALVVLVLASTTAMTASSTRRAEAICTGVGSPLTISTVDFSNGNIVAREGAPYPFTTCDADWQYSGIVQDSLTDGSCVSTYYLELLAYYANQATACTTGAWVAYSYSDVYGPNDVFVSPRPSYLPDDWRYSHGY